MASFLLRKLPDMVKACRNFSQNFPADFFYLNLLTRLTTHQGLSIVEILVSLLIVSLGIIGFGLAIPLGEDSLEMMGEERTALFLAKQMMEEIQTKAYEDPNQIPLFGVEGGEAAPRVNFDDIDDYDNWNQSPPQYPDGTLLNGESDTPDYRGFRRQVAAESVADNDYSALRADGTTSSKRITVTVSSEKNPPLFEDVVIKWVANKEGMELMY